MDYEMSSEEYLTIKPSELKFPTAVKMQVHSSLQLMNKNEIYIAFKVKITNPERYVVHPDHGVVWPQSTCYISVIMAQTEFPNDMQSKDMVSVISVITDPANSNYLDMFSKGSGYLLQECRLRVSYISQLRSPSSPIPEGYEECSTSQLDPGKTKITKKPKHQKSNAKSESVESLLFELTTDKPRRYSHENLISYTSNLSAKLGSGAFGTVYKGQLPNGREIAVKVLIDSEVVEEEFIAEVSTMGRTYHRNLVKLYGFCFDGNMKALVYQYAINGSLDNVLYDNRFDLKWEKLYDIAVETAKALVYLHDGCYQKIIHHDIKPANVLLDQNFSPMITDFGLAKLMNRNLSHLTLTRFRGTAGYAAPENWMPLSEITYKCDVYSFGMMLFEILGRKKNVTKEVWLAKLVWEKFEKGQLDDILVQCGITLENIEKAKILGMVALWCIQFTPETRPSMNTVSTVLEKEIQITAPPNPFLPSPLNSSMQPLHYSQPSSLWERIFFRYYFS